MKALVIVTFLLLGGNLISQDSTSHHWNQGMRYILSGTMLIEKDQANIGGGLKALHFINNHGAIGGSISYTPYKTGLDEAMINVGVEGLWTWKKKVEGRTVPFVNVSSGLGFLQGSNDFSGLDISTSSKVFFHPSIGIADYTKSGIALVFTAGYIIQGLDISTPNGSTDVSLNYSRYLISIGVSF